MKIPFLSFDGMHRPHRQTLLDAMAEVLDSNWFIMGKALERFEQAYAAYHPVGHCVGVANGLDALHLALRALNIGAGDEVIVPSNTYIASWLSVSMVGATPVPVEPRLHTYNINPELIEAAITPRTKAIMPVHLYGQICEMEAIMDIAQRHGLYVVEDNAQAQGTAFAQRKAGAWGHINAVSFYPGKNLGALGDAGAITTDDAQLAQRVRVLRNYGSEKKYYNQEKGYNSRLDELQAALLSAKLPLMDGWNAERVRLAEVYLRELAGVEGLVLPVVAAKAESNYHLFVVRCQRRDALQQHLANQGIGTLIHYPVPPHLQAAYRELNWPKGKFPLAEEIAETALSLPMYPGLKVEEIAYICEQIRAFFA